MKLDSAQQPTKFNRRSRRKRKIPFYLVLMIFCVSFMLGYWKLEGYLNKPQALLVLGGDLSREVFAANFARSNPELSVWVSSGSNLEYAEWMFEKAGINRDRLYLDYQAVDTVTNFTTMVVKLKQHNIKSVYLVTSDYHMPRAKVIGTIVLGSQGIHFRPLAVPSDRSPEPVEKSVRDGLRALLWVTTGHTGVSLIRYRS